MVNYDDNGNVLKKMTAQGYADSSAWARGQAWGLYGYTVRDVLQGTYTGKTFGYIF